MQLQVPFFDLRAMVGSLNNTFIFTLNPARSFVQVVVPSKSLHWIMNMWDSFSEVLGQPHFYKPLMAFWVSLVVIYILLSCLGFAPQGVIAGSVAAGFQSWAYGGFTPASGLFATLTSIGMLGLAQPVFAGIALLVAVVVAAVVAAFVR